MTAGDQLTRGGRSFQSAGGGSCPPGHRSRSGHFQSGQAASRHRSGKTAADLYTSVLSSLFPLHISVLNFASLPELAQRAWPCQAEPELRAH
jgi:hypothetical protein